MSSRLPGADRLDPRKVVLLLAAYFLLHLLVRVLVSDSLELDEAEQFVLAQELHWGYGVKPPLYTWLQIAFFRVLGANVFSLSLLKNLLLFSTYVFTYLAAREASGRTDAALVASSSLLLIPQIAWESQRDLTHSVLATACAAATLYLFLRLRRRRSASSYLLFGLVAGLGVLSKYNYAIFLFALAGSALSLRAFRPPLLDRRMLLAVAAFAALTGGYFLWLTGNADAALAHTGKLQAQGGPGLLQGWAVGVSSLFKAGLSFLGPVLGVFALLFLLPRGAGGPPSPSGETTRLMGRTLLFTLAFCLLLVFGFQATHFKDRWMQPLLFHVPVYLVLLAGGRIDGLRTRRFLLAAGAAAALVLTLLPSRTLLASALGDFEELNFPFSAFSSQLRSAGFERGDILAEDPLTAGNLKLHFPESAVAASGLPRPRLSAAGPLLLAWNATRHPLPPADLLSLAAEAGAPFSADAPFRYLEAPYKYGEGGKSMRLGFILVMRPALGQSSPANLHN